MKPTPGARFFDPLSDQRHHVGVPLPVHLRNAQRCRGQAFTGAGAAGTPDAAGSASGLPAPGVATAPSRTAAASRPAGSPEAASWRTWSHRVTASRPRVLRIAALIPREPGGRRALLPRRGSAPGLKAPGVIGHHWERGSGGRCSPAPDLVSTAHASTSAAPCHGRRRRLPEASHTAAVPAPWRRPRAFGACSRW